MSHDPLGTFAAQADGSMLRRYERHYPCAIEIVWDALTQPARLWRTGWAPAVWSRASAAASTFS